MMGWSLRAEGAGTRSPGTGIEWVLNNAEALESYARHIRRDIIQQVSVWTAIAAEDLHEGDAVGVYMEGGWLYARKVPRNAMGNAVMDANKGEDVGISTTERAYLP